MSEQFSNQLPGIQERLEFPNHLYIESFNANILKSIVQQREKNFECDSDSDSSSLSDLGNFHVQRISSPRLNKLKNLASDYASLSPPIPEFHTRTFKDVNSPMHKSSKTAGSGSDPLEPQLEKPKVFKLHISEVPTRRKTADMIDDFPRSEFLKKQAAKRNSQNLSRALWNQKAIESNKQGALSPSNGEIPELRIRTLKGLDSPSVISRNSNITESEQMSEDNQKSELGFFDGRLKSLPNLPNGILKKSNSQSVLPKFSAQLQKRVSFQNIRFDIKKIKNSEIPTFSTNQHKDFF